MQNQTMVSISEAARLFEVSSESVRQWLIRGKLKGIRTPLGRLVDREDAERRERRPAAAGAP